LVQPVEEETSTENDDLPWASAGHPSFSPANTPPPKNNGNGHPPHGLVQRKDEEDDDTPTEEEKAIARANARAALAQAQQTTGEARSEIAKSRQEKAGEQQAGETAKARENQAKTETLAQAGANGAGAAAPEAVAAAAPPTPAAPETAQAVPAGGGLAAAGAETDGAPAAEAAPTAEKAPASPQEDPAFQAVAGKVRGTAGRARKHDPAGKKAAETQAAVEQPAAEKQARASSNQVGEMQAAPAPAFDTAGFKAQLMQRIQDMAPRNTEQADDFKENNQLGSVKDEAKGKAKDEQAAVKQPTEEKAAQPPDPGSVEPKPVTPLQPETAGSAPQNIPAGGAAPKPKTAAEVEAPVKENTARVDQEMAAAGVTESQMANSKEPQFTDALGSKKEAEVQAETAPQAYRQDEQATLSQAQGEAVAATQERTQAMHSDKAGQLGQVAGQQTQAKSKNEQARARISAEIQRIYDKTKANVERILSELDGKVEKAFDEGSAAAKQAFEDYVDARMEAYKEDRYGGWFGWARWIDDKITSMPSEVNVFYTEGRNLFIQKMDAVIDNVVAIVGRGLAEARAEISNGKKEIQAFLDSLPNEEKKVGQELAESAQEKFNALEESVNNKQNELIDSLAQKYQEKLNEVDARIEELKAANAGLVDRAINAIKGVIEVIRKIKELITTVLAKIAEVVGAILDDPIGFLGNLISGIKRGFMNFIDNILGHLKAGLIGWLTGALGGAGIQIPEDIFSLEGIFSLVMQILGMSWSYIRAKAVKLLGEPAVKALETGFEIFKILITEGPAGLWKYVKEQFNDLKTMVMDAIQDMIITEVIKAGVKWILGLLNPAGAFIKAAMAIYDIVTFFIERGSQILDLINAVVDAVGAIGRGAIDAAASLIENALAKALPVVIGFLANLLGLGGLAKKVMAIIQKVRGKIDKAIDSLILKAKKFAGKALAKLGFGKNKEGKPDENAGVMGEVRAVVAQKSKRKFKDLAEAQEMVQGIYTEYQPKGLKSIRLVKTKDEKKNGFEVVASASPPEDVGDVEVGETGALPGGPEEFTDETIWEQAAGNTQADEQGPVTRLSQRSLSYGRTVLMTYITDSQVSNARKAAARVIVDTQLDLAAAATDGDSIYNYLRQASAAVNRLYNSDVVQLQVHHEERVRGNPATFARTRAQRIRASISRRINNNVQNLTPEEQAIAAVQDPARRLELIRLYAQQRLEGEIEDNPVQHEEVEMDVMTREAHLGGVHGNE